MRKRYFSHYQPAILTEVTPAVVALLQSLIADPSKDRGKTNEGELRLELSKTLGELRDKAGARIEVALEHPADVGRLRVALAAAGWSLEEGSLVVHGSAADAAALNRAAYEAGITLSRLTPIDESLENVFLEMTAAPTPNPVGASQGARKKVAANA